MANQFYRAHYFVAYCADDFYAFFNTISLWVAKTFNLEFKLFFVLIGFYQLKRRMLASLGTGRVPPTLELQQTA